MQITPINARKIHATPKICQLFPITPSVEDTHPRTPVLSSTHQNIYNKKSSEWLSVSAGRTGRAQHGLVCDLSQDRSSCSLSCGGRRTPRFLNESPTAGSACNHSARDENASHPRGMCHPPPPSLDSIWRPPSLLIAMELFKKEIEVGSGQPSWICCWMDKVLSSSSC